MLLPANPKASYLSQKDEIDHAIREVMDSGWYILGQKVKAFEDHFAEYIGTEYCVGLKSGTDALHFALRACGVEPGDAVITVTHTAGATVAAIDWLGAIPILVDIDPTTYTIDPQKTEDTFRRASVNRIKAIIAVHLYGHPADMTALTEIAQRCHLHLIEDCAQAHGASINDKRVGAFGICGGFSFYPTKNLGAFGDAGAVVTNDSSSAERLRLLQQYGWRQRYISEEIGYNSRLDEIQAAILDCKLPQLDTGNNRRREIADLYNRRLAGLPITLPTEQSDCRHVYHQYVIRCGDRGALRQYLKKQDIHTSILYPMPVHLQPGYKERVINGEGGFAVSEKISREILCLPIYPELNNSEVEEVIESIRTFYL